MAGKLSSYVHVEDPEHGAAVFGPKDEVPAWALPHITNPKAWEDGIVPEAPETDDASSEGDGDGSEPPKAPRRRS